MSVVEAGGNFFVRVATLVAVRSDPRVWIEDDRLIAKVYGRDGDLCASVAGLDIQVHGEHQLIKGDRRSTLLDSETGSLICDVQQRPRPHHYVETMFHSGGDCPDREPSIVAWSLSGRVSAEDEPLVLLHPDRIVVQEDMGSITGIRICGSDEDLGILTTVNPDDKASAPPSYKKIFLSRTHPGYFRHLMLDNFPVGIDVY